MDLLIYLIENISMHQHMRLQVDSYSTHVARDVTETKMVTSSLAAVEIQVARLIVASRHRTITVAD